MIINGIVDFIVGIVDFIIHISREEKESKKEKLL